MKQYVGRFLIFFCFFVSLNSAKYLTASAQGDSEFEEGGVGSDDEDAVRSSLKVNFVTAKNAQKIKNALKKASAPDTTLSVWDSDETLTLTENVDYKLLYSPEMLREYRQYWQQVGRSLESSDSHAFKGLGAKDNFAFSCSSKTTHYEMEYKLVDEGLVDIFAFSPDMDHVICTGRPPLKSRVEATHTLLGYDFSVLYRESPDLLSVFCMQKVNYFKSDPCPGWLYSNTNGKPSEGKGGKIFEFYTRRSADRARLSLPSYTHIFFIDNNKETLFKVREYFQRSHSDLDIILTLIHSTKAADDMRRQVEEEDRINRMAKEYKRLVKYTPPVALQGSVQGEADDDGDPLIVSSDESLSPKSNFVQEENEENKRRLFSQPSSVEIDGR